ncbi:unnamed protein product, partial [Scytosiphon promiscuus]
MEHGGGDFGWQRVEELGTAPGAEKALAESIRAKTLEFERERQGYIDAAKRLLAPAPPSAATADPSAAGATPSEDNDRRWTAAAPRESGQEGGGAGWHGRRLASEEIRTLQHRKADANVRLQAERLSNLEHGLELGVLRLERLLDRERILELLRLTDPDQTSVTRAADVATIARGGAGGTAHGNGERGRDGGEQGERVSEELIEELEERVAEAEERVRSEASRVGAVVAGRLEERARREEESRREESSASDEILRLQTALRDKEERLANTVVSYLELRHAMLRAQRLASEAREDAAKGRAVDEEEMKNCKSFTVEQTRAINERVDRTCVEVSGELKHQIHLREDEACMLREQRAEAEELYEARAVRLESLLDEWNAKHAALRRRFSLETEGFRRDADNIGRRFERIRAGPRGGRPAISSRSGSSARHAIERAMYSVGSKGTGGTAAALAAAAG